MLMDFTEVFIDGVEKILVEKNIFETKVRVLTAAPEAKFLLFIPGNEPADKDNWLLDIQLANKVFSSDPVSIFRNNLGLHEDRDGAIKEHLPFFGAKARVSDLADLIDGRTVAHDEALELLMMAVILKTTPRLSDLLLALLTAGTNEAERLIGELDRCRLTTRLWEYAQRDFAYDDAPTPNIEDFESALFLTALAELVPGERGRLNTEGRLLLDRWKDSTAGREAFIVAAKKWSTAWTVGRKIARLRPEEIKKADFFPDFDELLLAGLRDELINLRRRPEEVINLLRSRRTTFWYNDPYQHYYKAMEAAAVFLDLQPSLHLRSGAQNVLDDYIKEHYAIDAAYRRFHYHRENAHGGLINSLNEEIESRYVDGFLLKINNHWQDQLQEEGFPPAGLVIDRQRDFWKDHVQADDNRLFVIISDGMRYETGVEINDNLNVAGRYESSVSPMLATAPTFTQLGMAALLPHDNLTLLDNGYVEADGQRTAGTEARDKILKAATGGEALAIQATDFLKTYSAKNGRQLIKPFKTIYIYLDLVDKAGENEEAYLFRRTHESFTELEKLLRRIYSLNGYNVLITADHGHLYQTEQTPVSDFLSGQVSGDTEKINRRFVLGRNLEAGPGLMHLTTEQLGLSGDLDVVIPKSVNRLRRSGSGSRYVHGGLSLQELIVPVVTIRMLRKVDERVRPVDVEVLGSTDIITNNQKSIRLLQSQPVVDKFIGRTLLIGFYDEEDHLVSNEVKMVFDKEAKEDRLREDTVKFIISQSAASRANARVTLRLRDPQGPEYLRRAYVLRIAFARDFDL